MEDYKKSSTKTAGRTLVFSVAVAAMVAACGQSEPEPEPTPTPEAEVTEAAASPSATPTPSPTAEPASGEVNPQLWPAIQSGVARDPAIEAEVERLLATMTIEQKVGQIIQADIGSITPELAAEYQLGSVLNGGNSAPNGDNRSPAADWLALADAYWDASIGPDGTGIPIIWGTDAVHGHSNIVGATIFPHNIGLGAANDPDLIKRIGAITAREIKITGLDWTFAPTLATPRDDRWGRTYEGYAEDGEIVAAYARAMVEGLQGEPGTDEFLGQDKVVSTAKHFLGDGGTKDGVDQGETIATEAQLRDIHGAGYPPSIGAGVQTVMASFSSWNGRKMHGYGELLTDVLVDQMGFDGFVVGDWNGHGQVAGCEPTSCAKSVNAGVDMFMAPDSWRELYNNTLAQVQAGEITQERLDEAVSRVLRVKLRYDIFDRGRPSSRPMAGRFDQLGSDAHRAVAQEAVRKSLVLLKNDGVLPLAPNVTVLVAGDGADSIMKQTGGWTLSWQGDGNSNEDFPNGQSILDGVRETVDAAGGDVIFSEDGQYSDRPDVAIVVFGEDPYAEFMGDRLNVDYPDNDTIELLRSLRADGVPLVSVFLSGRPLWVNPELNASNAFVAAWLPGTEGGGVADVLFASADGSVRHDFTGKLSFSWPARPDQNRLNRGDDNYDPLFAYGFGLSYGDDGSLAALPEDYEVATGGRDVVFADGTAQGGWQLDDARNGTGVALSRVDRNAQEDSLKLVWGEDADAAFSFSGEPTDWTRQANAELALSFDYRLDAPLDGAISVGIGCGPDCGAAFGLNSMVEGDVGQWRTASVRLSCFGDQGLDLANVQTPFALRSRGANAMSVSSVRLAPSPGGATCPSE